ncbi:LysR family transcriptional regulator [Vibrio renipiscarius]|uniref:LysR family transcriptional regulator n=1 Tax=Vibrio renipiscarius TaxID=1461322 RepID=A0A0C2NA12_9VIBR|nr:LysR family transcriptional regulator [Vibrio renipiscarius]KII76496.1 LysR family transcriptional regulator [Vibrio renipiscarius]KII77982.1 LysR family transcriptional regulator [Vibrio renipiscarius]
MLSQTNLLDGMVIFTTVVDQGSFTNAANVTGHSTSFISKEINKLEERLGVRLLHRTTRTLSLTPEGKLYFQQSKQLIESAQELEQAINGRQQEPKGVLKISCPVSFGADQLSPILAKYMQMYPKVTLEVFASDHKVDLIGEGYDVVLRSSATAEDSSLISRRVQRSCTRTVASPSYLQQHGTPKHPSELIKHKLLCYSNHKQPYVWNYIDSDGSLLRVDVTSVMTTNSPEMELSLCVLGQGICRLPEAHVQGGIERGELVELFTDLPVHNIEMCLVYPSRKHMSTKVRCFIDLVVEELT